ncbi:serine/threonine-protein phosphatase 6 regulatory ankyrin repeat subunit A-like [Homalodisca vitripennis]|uniref:serine/threonine-protein phosphatase 6 regulatory ankyrin repeat subunit A-like n=1 Tax=Homalodisca vitripennis TaxID=197043 RepID=UPI001EEABBCB|nr:serine/threonine-protein phosphatase 6 regulatory ankyrin repeat subunit A-like [Homalodisca vitripennis]
MATQLSGASAKQSMDNVEKRLPQVDSDREFKRQNGCTPLHLAVKRKMYLEVDLLLEKGACVNVIDDWGNTPLCSAVARCDDIMVKLLIQKGADVNYRNALYQTPLFVAERIKIIQNSALSAARKRRLDEIISLLLSKQSDINVQDLKGDSLLHTSCFYNYTGTFQHLTEAGADVNLRNDYMYETPLHIAAKTGFVEATELLLGERAELDAQNHKGNTPLMLSCRCGCAVILKRLIDSAADVNVRNVYGETALHIAVTNLAGHERKERERNSSNCGALRSNAKNCLHVTCHRNSYALVEHLITAGAKVNVINNRGRTPLQIIAELFINTGAEKEILFDNNIRAMKLLLKKGADSNDRGYFDITPWMLISDFSPLWTESRIFMCQMILDWSYVFQRDVSDWGASLSREYSECVMQLKKHTVKLKCANLPFDKQVDITSETFHSWQSECCVELGKAKNARFGSHTLHDVLCNGYLDSDPTYVSNEELERAIFSSDLESKFPIYASLLQAKFTRDKRRKHLLDSAVDRLTVLLHESESVNYVYLPNEILRKILSHTDDNCLKRVINS